MLLHPSSVKKCLERDQKKSEGFLAPPAPRSPPSPGSEEPSPLPPTPSRPTGLGSRALQPARAGAESCCSKTPASAGSGRPDPAGPGPEPPGSPRGRILPRLGLRTRRRKIPLRSRGRESRLTPAPRTSHPAPHMKYPRRSFSRGFFFSFFLFFFFEGGEAKRRKLSVLLLHA